ncbi:MAG TPA: adenine-specific DNA methylase, partial [Oscillatoriales bacterium UBA8482]|nr:adenine-specific DNA methylase [Oscillatoriales bacterium UBA8482]
AAVFASLVAAPESHQKRTALKQFMIDLCKWETGTPTLEKARKQILEAQKIRLNLPENTPLDEVPPPKVLDMFAGGGAIPLEALRLGCETYAVDLNPVAHIIELCTLVYPQKYGKNLADEVEKWGNWVIENVRDEIGDLYPAIRVGEILISEGEQLDLFAQSQPKQLTLAQSLTPVAYLWTRTVKCPNPSCGATVPLVRQTWLCKKSKKYVALQVIPNYQTKKVEFKVIESNTENGLGFDPNSGSTRGNSICRHCGTTVDVKYVKQEGVVGKINQQLMAIVCTTSGEQGKTYLSATDYLHYLPDDYKIKIRLEKLCEETGLTVPNEPLPEYGVLGFRVQPYGLLKWLDLFTPRQLLSLMTFVKWVKLAHQEILQQGYEEELAKAIVTYLSLNIDKVADYSSSLARWGNDDEGVTNTFSRQALPMVWDFAETNILGEKTGAFKWGINFIKYFISEVSSAIFVNQCKTLRASSMSMSIESESLDAVITDPPYFDSVPYADLSDFFYVWLKRSIGHLYKEHFSGQLTPKKNEAIMEPSRHGGDKKKAAKAYEDMMHQAFCEANRVLKEAGMMVVVYAHKTTAGWSTLIDSLRRAKFTITEAWPLDTEMGSRLRGQNSAALASSIFLVARKRTNTDIGDYAMDVQPQLKSIIQDRVKSLMSEGVAGADLIIACVGAGLRAYTQYDKVELPNGDELDANSFLDEVQKEVLETVLTEVLLCDKKGVSFVDKPTQYYILARYEYGEAVVEFDEANSLARGVGVELDSLRGLTDGKLALVKITKNQVQLQDYSQRGEVETLGIQKTEKPQAHSTGSGHGFNQIPQSIGLPPTLIDILHRLLWLAEHQPQNVNNFLAQSMPDATQL